MSLNKKYKVNQEPVDVLNSYEDYVEDDDYYTDYSYLDDSVIQKAEDKSFPDDKIEQLIEAIQSKPVIWNIKSKDYRNRVVTSNAWDDVLSEINLNKEYKNKARKRWDSLKSGYGRSKNAPSGSGAKPRYKYGHLLSFLDDTREPRCTTSMMNSADGPPATCKTNKKDESPNHKNFQMEALKILNPAVVALQKVTPVVARITYVIHLNPFKN